MNTETIIIIVVAVGVAYLFFGKKALFGLLALIPVLLKGKGSTTGESVAKIEGEIDVYKKMQKEDEALSKAHMSDAMESHSKAVDIAEDTTEPEYHDLPSGFKRRHRTSK